MQQISGEGSLSSLQRLSGGANMETWSFDWQSEKGVCQPLILRRFPGNSTDLPAVEGTEVFGRISLDTEAELLTGLEDYGLKVPGIIGKLTDSGTLGNGYIMSRENGQALPKKVLYDERYGAARKTLAFECGRQLAIIHSVPLDRLPSGIADQSIAERLDKFESLMSRFEMPMPVHQLAINWLRENAPDSANKVLLHGDFRTGNLLVDERGLSAVLDWELAHLGDPLEDLGYLCANVWRFGSPQNPVGGFGQYQDLFDGYQSEAGWRPELAQIKYWEVFAAVTWGMCCLLMEEMYHSGVDRSLERLAVGRRLSESEVDSLLLLEEVGALPDCEKLAATEKADPDNNTRPAYFSTDAAINAVRESLVEQIIPELSGFARYNARVAANSLSIAIRDIALRDSVSEIDQRIAEFVSAPGGSNDPNSINSTIKQMGGGLEGQLIRLLKQRTLIRMQIDNPNYWGYLDAKHKW